MLETIKNYVAITIFGVIGFIVAALIFGLDSAARLLTIAVVIWVVKRLWGLCRLWMSISASKGDEAAMALEKLRFKSTLLRFLFTIAVILSFGVAMWACLSAGVDARYALAISALVAILCGTPFWVTSARYWEQYEKGFKGGFVTSALSGVFDNLKYDPHGEFSASDLRALDFFEHFDRFAGNDLIEAEYKGIRFVQGDVRVQEHYTVTTEDSNGNTRTSHRWRTEFFGRAMRFDFADAFRGPVQVVQKDFGAAKVRSSGEWQRVETELAEFALDFDIFARDPVDAMAVLTPMMVEGIFYLYHKLACPMAFYFTGNAMFAMLPLKRDPFDVAAGRTLLEEREELERDLSTITGFLDTMYFKRQAAAAPDPDAEPVAEPDAAETPVPDAGAGEGAALPPQREEFVRSAAVEAARLKRNVSGGVWAVFKSALYVVFAAYILSLIYALSAFSDGIALGFSYSGGEFTLHAADVPIYVYVLAINGFFVLPVTAAACFTSKSIIASLVLLVPAAIHFLVLYCNALGG